MTHRPCRLTCSLLLAAQALTGCATPLSAIDRIAVRRFSAGRTVVAVLGGAVVAGLGFLLYILQTIDEI